MWPPVVWLALSFGVGVGGGLLLGWVWPVAVAAAMGAAVFRGRAPRVAALALWLAVGWANGRWGARREAASCAARWPEGPRAAQLILLDRVAARGVMATALVVADRCRGRIRVRWEAPDTAPGGARVVAVGRWRGVLRVGHARVLNHGGAWRGRLRGAIEARLERLFGARADLTSALVVARAGAVPRDVREEFVHAGLAHLLAISGLHVGFVAWWVAWLLAQAGVSTQAARLAAAAGAFAYAWVLGFPAPATRAACFLVIAATARARQRRPAPAGVLALAAIGVLSVDPTTVRSVGAWLSLGAVAGVVWAGRHLPGPRAVSTALGATLFTAPITALVFGTVAPIGVASNLVAVPLAAVAVPGIGLALLADLIARSVGGILASGAGVALALIDQTAGWAARVPYGHLVMAAGPEAAAPWLALLGAALWARWRRPTLGVTLRRLAVPAALAAWAWAAAGVVRRDEGPDLAIHFLAVGQGDAAAIRTPRGRWVLVDGGPRTAAGDAGRRVVVPFLRRRGVTSVAAVLLSHGDADHLGGLIAALDALPAGHVWEPGQPLGQPLYLAFLSSVEASGAVWHPARRGDRLEIDSVVFVVHHPDSAWLATSLDVNENSLVVEVIYRQFRALFPGDAGAPMEWLRAGGIEPVSVLKVGHHGSASATTGAWLDRLRPRVAVVSVGAANRYGHPTPEVLERLTSRDIAVYRTDRDGSVVIRTDGLTFTVGTTR